MISNSIQYNKILKWKLQDILKTNSLIMILGPDLSICTQCANAINNIMSTNHPISQIEINNSSSLKTMLNLKKQFLLTTGNSEIATLNKISNTLINSKETRLSSERLDSQIAGKIHYVINIIKSKNCYKIHISEIGYSPEDKNFIKTYSLKFV